MKIISLLTASLRIAAVSALVLLCPAPAFAQSYQYEIAIPNETWVHQSNKATLDGGSIIVTKSQSTTSATRYINLVKLDNAGTLQWQKSFGPLTCTFDNIVQSPDSGYFLCATAFSAMSYMVLKVDKYGNLQFSRRIEVPAPYAVLHEGESIAKNDGGFYISSTLFDSSTATQCWHLVELDQYGIPVLSRLYDLNSSKTRCYGIDTCSNGDVLMLGSVFSSPYHWFKVARIDRNTGAQVWCKRFKSQTGFTLMPGDIVCDTADQIYVLTQFNSSLTPHVGLTKIDGAGNGIWTMEYSDNANALRPRTLMHTDSGAIVIAGEELFLKVDANGSLLSSTRFANTIFYAVDSPDQQSFQLTGSYAFSLNSIVLSTDAVGHGCTDSLQSITKTPRPVYDSTILSTMVLPLQNFVFNLPPVIKSVQLIDDCEMTAIDEPGTTDNVQLFPNPAKSLLTVHSETTICSAEIFSVTGQSVLTEVQKSNEYKLDISDFSPGYYVIRVVLENRIETLPLIVE